MIKLSDEILSTAANHAGASQPVDTPRSEELIARCKFKGGEHKIAVRRGHEKDTGRTSRRKETQAEAGKVPNQAGLEEGNALGGEANEDNTISKGSPVALGG